MKKRYVQFQKDKTRVFINHVPDRAMGPVIEVSDAQWEKLYRRPVNEWTIADGRVVFKSARKRAALLAAGAAAAGAALWALL